MTASLTGTPVMMPAADPLGRPMAGTYGGGAPLGKPAAYEPEGPNWVIIGSIGGVALVLLILVGVIVATSLSGGGATNVASSTTPAVNVAPATEPAIPPAPAPTPNTPAVAATVPMAEIPPPQPAASTVSLAPMSPPMEFGSAGTPPTGTPPIGSSPGSPPPGTGGPGAIAAGPPKTVPTTSSTSSGPGGSSAQSGSQPGVKMVKIISRKDSKATVETPESVPANPRGFATALPVWHGDSRSKLTGVLRIGNDTRTTLQGQYSWMHNILPFMGHQDIYDKFDLKKPLHDETNMVSGCILVPEFLVPGNPKQRWEGYPFEHLALTHFVGMSGIEDARNVVAGKFDRSDPRAGIFGYERIAAPSEITDGTSNTIMVIGVGDLANPWVMGGGSTIRGARQPYFDKLSGFGSYGQKGAITMMADGSVRLISENIDPAVFRAMCTMHGAETVDLPAAAPPFKLD